MDEKQLLKILIVAPEVSPFVKTGGLADVVGQLPAALKALGHDVRVAVPRYGLINTQSFQKVLADFPVPLDSTSEQAGVWQGVLNANVPIYFVENAHFFEREGVYMYLDDAERFIFFCRAVLEMLPRLGWQPDIIHTNDWQTAIIPNWLKTIYAPSPFFQRTASVYTIHNLAYQGIFGQRVLEIAGLASYGFIVHPEVATDVNEAFDFMARGILFADAINTVSERYAREIQTKEFGEKLDPILRMRAARLNTPVLILSGLSRPQAKVKGFGAGADEFIGTAVIADEIQAAVGGWTRLRDGSL